MSKRKELILKAIYAHTLECLEDKQYDKLGMDASSLAMDLRLDRSNAPRRNGTAAASWECNRQSLSGC